MLNDLVQLKTKIETHRSPINLIENLTKGKNVLNVGAAGGVDGPGGYLPNNEDKWLHFKILKKAKTVLATDIDNNAIKHAKENGYKIESRLTKMITNNTLYKNKNIICMISKLI